MPMQRDQSKRLGHKRDKSRTDCTCLGSGGSADGIPLKDRLERAYRDGIQNVSKLLAQTPKESMPSIARWIRENPIVGDIVELEGWVFTSRDEVSERQKRAAYLTETVDSAGG